MQQWIRRRGSWFGCPWSNLQRSPEMKSTSQQKTEGSFRICKWKPRMNCGSSSYFPQTIPSRIVFFFFSRDSIPFITLKELYGGQNFFFFFFFLFFFFFFWKNCKKNCHIKSDIATWRKSVFQPSIFFLFFWARFKDRVNQTTKRGRKSMEVVLWGRTAFFRSRRVVLPKFYSKNGLVLEKGAPELRT